MNKKILNLVLSILLVLSLVACGSQSAKNDSKAIPNESIESIAGTSSDQNTSADASALQADIDNKQSVSDGNNTDSAQVNSNGQNSTNTQASLDQDKSDKIVSLEQDVSNEKVSLDQNTQSNSDVANNVTIIGDNVVLDIKQEEATTAPLVANIDTSSVSKNNSKNDFNFIAAGSFKNVNTYINYLKNNGATYVSSTQEAVSIIKNVCQNSGNGVNLCFLQNVNIDSLVDALPKDITLSGYIDVNTYQCEWKSNSYYFGVKFTWWTSSSEQTAVDSLVAQVLPTLNQGTVYNKIKNVHDYICSNVNYCYDTLAGNADNFSAYDALIGHKAVCQGYALAFQKFMDSMGIPCYIAKGDIDVNGTTGPHAWNIVKLNGNWYSVDCTWDGQDNNTRYDYFLLGVNEYPYGITGGISLAASRYSN